MTRESVLKLVEYRTNGSMEMLFKQIGKQVPMFQLETFSDVLSHNLEGENRRKLNYDVVGHSANHVRNIGIEMITVRGIRRVSVMKAMALQHINMSSFESNSFDMLHQTMSLKRDFGYIGLM